MCGYGFRIYLSKPHTHTHIYIYLVLVTSVHAFLPGNSSSG